jgi:hypothetical protein
VQPGGQGPGRGRGGGYDRGRGRGRAVGRRRHAGQHLLDRRCVSGVVKARAEDNVLPPEREKEMEVCRVNCAGGSEW